MGEYDDMFRPSVAQRLQQAARERAELSAELDTLRAENERLKRELAAYEDADGMLQSQLEAAQLEIDEGKAWLQRAEQAEAELREAQATIERVREAISTHIPEPPSHDACSSELELRSWALLCELDHVFALHAERMQKLVEEARKGGG